jgi:hypothetical protein
LKNIKINDINHYTGQENQKQVTIKSQEMYCFHAIQCIVLSMSPSEQLRELLQCKYYRAWTRITQINSFQQPTDNQLNAQLSQSTHHVVIAFQNNHKLNIEIWICKLSALFSIESVVWISVKWKTGYLSSPFPYISIANQRRFFGIHVMVNCITVALFNLNFLVHAHK